MTRRILMMQYLTFEGMGCGGWWRATTTATTTAKEAILPYQTMTLPAATGTTTERTTSACAVEP